MRYIIVTTADIHIPAHRNKSGLTSARTIPANSVVNAIDWDGETPYNPGPTLILVQSDTLQIGDIYTGA